MGGVKGSSCQFPRKVVVVGTGAFAQGLVSLAHRSGATATYDIVFANRRAGPGASSLLPGLPDSPVFCTDDVIGSADMVILAIPASGLPSFVAKYGQELAGKIVVDVTNTTPGDLGKLTGTPQTASKATFKLLGIMSQSKSVSDVLPAAHFTGSSLDMCAEMGGGSSEAGSSGGRDVEADKDVDQHRHASSYAKGAAHSAAGWLAGVLPSSARVVKSFCNLSAYTLLHGDPLTEHMKSVAASNCVEAAAAVADFGRALGLEMREVPSLVYASKLESRQRSLLPAWQWPTWLMLGTWLLTHIYSFIRYNYFGGSAWQHITMWILNKSVGWVALWGMAYTYLPGVLVCYMQLVLRRPSVRLPGWLKAWMDGRKQLGLLSLAAMLLHLLLSTFLWMPSYYSKLWEATDTAIVPSINGTALDNFGMMKGGNSSAHAGLKVFVGSNQSCPYALMNGTATAAAAAAGCAANAAGSGATVVLTAATKIITLRSKLNWIGEASTFLGIISGCLMGLIALTSVPCVTPKMNWREWRLLQSQSGWLAVITATVHVLLLGAPAWPRYKTEWPAMIPTITLMSTLLPMLLLLLKGLLVLPPISCVLARIRSGAWARKDSSADALNNIAAYAVEDH